MPNKISEECKRRLREIEGHLSYIFFEPTLVTPRLHRAYPDLRKLVIAGSAHIDEECRKLLRDCERQINSIVANEKNTPDNEDLVENLRSLYTAFQDIARHQLY